MFCRRSETEKQTTLQSWQDPPAMGAEATGWPEELRSVLCPGFHLGPPVLKGPKRHTWGRLWGRKRGQRPTVCPPPSGLSQGWCP